MLCCGRGNKRGYLALWEIYVTLHKQLACRDKLKTARIRSRDAQHLGKQLAGANKFRKFNGREAAALDFDVYLARECISQFVNSSGYSASGAYVCKLRCIQSRDMHRPTSWPCATDRDRGQGWTSTLRLHGSDTDTTAQLITPSLLNPRDHEDGFSIPARLRPFTQI